MKDDNKIKGYIFIKDDEESGVKVVGIKDGGLYDLCSWNSELDQSRICFYWFDTVSELKNLLLSTIRPGNISEELMAEIVGGNLIPVEAEKDLENKKVYI